MQIIKTQLLVLGLLLVFSCKKIDTANQINPTNAGQNKEEKFFTQYASADPTIQALTKFVKNRNNKNHYVEKVINQIGYPLWNKAITRQRRTDLSKGTSTDSVQITYIPFVRDSQQYVNAALIIKTTDSDTTCSYICDWQYKNFSFDNTTTGWNAHSVFQLFTLLDYHTLGHTQFKIKDSLLFAGDNVTVTLLSTNEAAQRQALFVPSIECTFYQIVTCITGNGVRASAYATPCFISYQSFCTTIWTYVPEDGGGGGDVGGGGSDTPPPCGPGSGMRMQQNTNPCQPGWEPIINDENLPTDPCLIAQNAAKNMDSLFLKSKADSLLATIPNLATETNEKGFAIVKKLKVLPTNLTDTILTGYRCDIINTGTDSNIIISYSLGFLEFTAATLHTHPPRGYAAPSAKDVYTLIESYLQEPRHVVGNFVAAANGSQYALTITNPTQAATFLATQNQFLDGADWKKDSDIGKAFIKAREHFEKIYKDDPNYKHLAYEMAMAAVLNKYGSGLTLNKKDAAGNFKPIIVLTKPDPKKPKKTIYTQVCL